MGSESRQRIIETDNTTNGPLCEISIGVVTSKLPVSESYNINIRSEGSERIL